MMCKECGKDCGIIFKEKYKYYCSLICYRKSLERKRKQQTYLIEFERRVK